MGPGGNPGYLVSVVRRIGIQVRLIDRPPIAPRQQRCINHRRVGGQRHSLGQAILKHARHQRTLLFDRGLLFNQRGHRHHTVSVPLQAQRGSRRTKLFHHRRHHLERRRSPAKLVGIGKQISLQRRRAGIEVGDQCSISHRRRFEGLFAAQLRRFHPRRNVEYVGTFRNRHRNRENIAPPNSLVNLRHSRRMVEAILAGLQRAALIRPAANRRTDTGFE